MSEYVSFDDVWRNGHNLFYIALSLSQLYSNPVIAS
jgi:hypothetical protein